MKKTATTRSEIFHRFIAFLNHRGMVYSVLGDYRFIPENMSDLDICLENPKELFEQLPSFFRENRIVPLTCRYHATGIRLNLGPRFKGRQGWSVFNGPDILLFPTGNIRKDFGLDYRSLYSGRIKHPKGFFVPEAKDGFIFYIIRKIDKGDIDEKSFGFLRSFWFENRQRILIDLCRFFSEKSIEIIRKSLDNGDMATFMNSTLLLKADLASKGRFNLKRVGWDMFRVIPRILELIGFLVFPTGRIYIKGKDGG
jgi:hypothetical protein